MKALDILYTLISSGNKDVFANKNNREKLTFVAEAINELEERIIMSCEGCIHHLSANGNIPLSCCECSRFYADNYEDAK